MPSRSSHKKILLGTGLAMFAVLSLYACNFKEDKTTNQPAVTLDPSQTISFAEIKSQVLDPDCLSCHAASSGNLGGVNLETYSNVKDRLAAIKRVSVESKRMPPGDELSATAVATLRTWIEQGAPESK